MTETNDNTVAMSAEINKLAEALAKAQMEIKGAVKESENPYFHSRYADLSTIWDACREPLSKQGLAVIQTTDGTPELVIIMTTLAHSSGQWIRGRLAMKPVKADPQGIGSCLTYGRRYALAAIVGVAPEDDDGNHASGRIPDKAQKEPEQPKAHSFQPKRATPSVDKMMQTGQAVPTTPVAEMIPKGLQTLMELTGVSKDELRVYLEGKSFIPKGGRISDLDKNILEQMTEDKNWDIVVNKIKVARMAKATAA